LYELVGAGRIA